MSKRLCLTFTNIFFLLFTIVLELSRRVYVFRRKKYSFVKMTESISIDRNNYLYSCRICAKQSSVTKNLFVDEHNGKKLVDLLKFCIQRAIERNDGLPENICEECTSQLISTHEFHTLCFYSEQNFRKLLLSSNNHELKREIDSISEPLAKVEVIYESDYSEKTIILDGDVENALLAYDDNLSDSNVASKRDFKLNTKKPRTKPKQSTRFTIEIPRKKKRSKVPTRQSESIDTKSYECYQCKHIFSNLSHLRRHLNNHNSLGSKESIKPGFKCSFCEMRFTHIKSLFRHRRKHTTRVHECEYCPDAFETLTQLKQHLQIHQHELKLHTCDLCPRKFPLYFQLQHHRLNHEGAKRFDCNLCSKNFVTERLLRSHIRDVHTSKKLI